MGKALIIDVGKRTVSYYWQVSAKMSTSVTIGAPYAKPQPDTDGLLTFKTIATERFTQS